MGGNLRPAFRLLQRSPSLRPPPHVVRPRVFSAPRQVGNVDINDVLALGKAAISSNRRILDIFRMHLPEVERAVFVRSHPPSTPDDMGSYGSGAGASARGQAAAQGEDVESEV